MSGSSTIILPQASAAAPQSAFLTIDFAPVGNVSARSSGARSAPMATVLYIESSPLKQRSHTIEVAHEFLDAYRQVRPGDTIETIDLWAQALPPFDGATIEAKFAVLRRDDFTPLQQERWSAQWRCPRSSLAPQPLRRNADRPSRGRASLHIRFAGIAILLQRAAVYLRTHEPDTAETIHRYQGDIMGAPSPELCNLWLARAFNAQDVEAAAAMYHPEATIVRVDEVHGETRSSRGAQAIRETMAAYIDMKPHMDVVTHHTTISGEFAMTRSQWLIAGVDKQGQRTEVHHHGMEVHRRLPDGSWVFFMDHPFGADPSWAIERPPKTE